MLFCNVSLREAHRIKSILDLFMTAFGTQINNDKSCIYFFNTAGNIKNFLTRTLGFNSGELPTRYLGAPLALNPLRMVNWQQTLEKITRKLANWSFRTLNFAGRTILAKAILQSIPIYQLSAMAAPKGACNKMTKIFKKFIWGGNKNQKKWALVSWKEVVKRKMEGGLGLRDPYLLNQAMGAKLWWQWMKRGNDLWKKIWSKKDGSSARFSEEAWQQRDRMNGLQALMSLRQEAAKKGMTLVKDFWRIESQDETWRTWKSLEEWMEQIDKETKELYQKEMQTRRIPIRTGPDILRWGQKIKGHFSIK
eukprot:PITA_31482